MLTIGELAGLAGTTVRAVRHYHRIGLLPEPPRDRSGYRRYGAAALIRLLRVRRLRELGLALDRIGELLDGPEPALHEALDALDAELAAQAERIAAQREHLARLRAQSPDPDLPEPLAAMFAKAAADGAPARAIAKEKELLLLDLALHPERTDAIVAEYVGMFERLVQRTDYAELAHRFDALADVDADPATVDALAVELAAVIRAEHAAGDRTRGAWNPLAETLMTDWGSTMPPSQRRVMERAVELVADLF
ncbi:MerR family DNA-binding transcriptional regulator [Pseudonocardia lacus]|uniref:helix-turn-helix domain-containing protein n=1 Tax=Pseudonocardia lacus TaxID=2835865 RepID=UPI001BDDB794|nr:MerR family transcriptional regulator [Pseudonocardia lacus]